jgi:hypothetical protein
LRSENDNELSEGEKLQRESLTREKKTSRGECELNLCSFHLHKQLLFSAAVLILAKTRYDLVDLPMPSDNFNDAAVHLFAYRRSNLVLRLLLKFYSIK